MVQQATKRPDRRTVLIRRDDHDALKQFSLLTAPLSVPLMTVITAARLAFDSLTPEQQLGYIHQAAAMFPQHTPAG